MKQRLIDANKIPNYKYKVAVRAGDKESLCEFRVAHWKDIEEMPTVDPETLPIVQELREQLEQTKVELDAMRTSANSLKMHLDSAEARCATLDKLVKEYQEQLIPGYRERAEKAEQQRDDLFNLLNDVCKDVRETHVDDSVCGLCEYDGAHYSENGDCINECPGFDRDDCFCMKKSLREKYGRKDD